MQRAVVWVLAGLLYRTARCARVLLDGLQGGSDVSGAALVVMCQSLSRASLSHLVSPYVIRRVSVNADAGSLRVCCVPDAAFTFSYAGVARVMAHALMLC